MNSKIFLLLVLFVACTPGGAIRNTEKQTINSEKELNTPKVESSKEFEGYWYVPDPSKANEFLWIIRIDPLDERSVSWSEAVYEIGKKTPTKYKDTARIQKLDSGKLGVLSKREIGSLIMTREALPGGNKFLLNVIIPEAEEPPIYELIRATSELTPLFQKILGP